MYVVPGLVPLTRRSRVRNRLRWQRPAPLWPSLAAIQLVRCKAACVLPGTSDCRPLPVPPTDPPCALRTRSEDLPFGAANGMVLGARSAQPSGTPWLRGRRGFPPPRRCSLAIPSPPVAAFPAPVGFTSLGQDPVLNHVPRLVMRVKHRGRSSQVEAGAAVVQGVIRPEQSLASSSLIAARLALVMSKGDSLRSSPA